MTRVQVRPTARTRQRRRRRRIITLSVYIVIVFALAWYFDAQGTTTVIFVRHADIDRTMAESSPDTPLNAAGLARAEELADFLDSVDVVAGVNAIYVSEAKRTQQTAAPLAKRLDIEPEVADHYDVVGFMRTVLWDHKREIVLIVSHSDAIAPLVEELHGSKNIAEFAPDEYNRMYIVTIPWWGKVKTLEVPYTAW